MSEKPIKGPQIDALPRGLPDIEQISLNLEKLDDFVTSHAVAFVHYRAIPSPIGLKDVGEYRRSETLDTISENGFIYKKCGVFSAVLLSNSKEKKQVEGGLFDYSTARITLPRFYDPDSPEHAGDEIHLCPGDRVYIKDLEVKVVNYQRVEYEPKHVDSLQFPALCVEFLIDSLGREYQENMDFKVDKNGNIDWIVGKKNPGIDPDTGRGRIYSIRYKYNAHWYIASIPNEVRVGRVTDGDVRKPARFPYNAVIQREYIYHNHVRPPAGTQGKNIDERTVSKPVESIDPNKYKVKVNINNFEE